MALSRHTFSIPIDNGKGISPSKANFKIYHAVESGIIKVNLRTLEEGERLDQIAGFVYGNSSLWWIIAAASGIGWALQVPPGTRIRIPTNPSDVFNILL